MKGTYLPIEQALIEDAWAALQGVPSCCERALVDRQCDDCHVEYEQTTGVYVDEDEHGVSLCAVCAGLAG